MKKYSGKYEIRENNASIPLLTRAIIRIFLTNNILTILFVNRRINSGEQLEIKTKETSVSSNYIKRVKLFAKLHVILENVILIRCVVKCYEDKNRIESKRSGRLKLITRKEYTIVHTIKKNPEISVSKIVYGLKASYKKTISCDTRIARSVHE